jgi:hypothetical protein
MRREFFLKDTPMDTLRDKERNHMPEVHALTTWAPTSVEIERLSLLVAIQNFI